MFKLNFDFLYTRGRYMIIIRLKSFYVLIDVESR